MSMVLDLCKSHAVPDNVLWTLVLFHIIYSIFYPFHFHNKPNELGKEYWFPPTYSSFLWKYSCIHLTRENMPTVLSVLLYLHSHQFPKTHHQTLESSVFFFCKAWLCT